MPYLLTNLPKLHSDPKASQTLQYPNPIDISAPLKLSTSDINKNFTLLEGEINPEGSWVCDLKPEYTGPLFLQIIYAKKNGSTFEITGFLLNLSKNYIKIIILFFENNSFLNIKILCLIV